MTKQIPYTIKKSKRAKRMSLVVREDGGVVVILPYKSKGFFVDSFVKKNKNWILKNV